MRVAGGIIAGFLAGILAFLAISYLGDLMFPMSAEVDANDPEQVSGAFSSAPAGAKIMLLAALFGGALVGVWVADRVAHRRWAGWPLALFLVLFALGVVFMVTLPAWMQIALILAPILGALVAGHALPRAARPTVEEEEEEEEEPADAAL